MLDMSTNSKLFSKGSALQRMKGKVLFYPNLPKVVCIPIPSENIMNEDELYKHGEKTKQDEKEEYNCRY